MLVLVNLKEGVNPKHYERWVLESYAPAVRNISSVEDWRDYRATGLLGSDDLPPHDYLVTLEIEDPDQLMKDMSGGVMQGLLSELHELAEVTQIMAERFA